MTQIKYDAHEGRTVLILRGGVSVLAPPQKRWQIVECYSSTIECYSTQLYFICVLFHFIAVNVTADINEWFHRVLLKPSSDSTFARKRVPGKVRTSAGRRTGETVRGSAYIPS